MSARQEAFDFATDANGRELPASSGSAIPRPLLYRCCAANSCLRAAQCLSARAHAEPQLGTETCYDYQPYQVGGKQVWDEPYDSPNDVAEPETQPRKPSNEGA